MAKKSRRTENVRRQYRQLFISGFEHLAQSRDENGNSKTAVTVEGSPPIKRGARSYKVSLTFVIEQTGNGSNEYDYRILLDDDPDVFVVPYSIRGKKVTGQSANVPKKGVKGGDSFSMVYGVYEGRQHSLSHTPQHPLHRVAPQIYSFFLGAIDRAIESTILLPQDAPRNDDTGKRAEGTSALKSLGTDKKKRRGKTIRAEILPEAVPEEAAGMVETNGKILGERQTDREARLKQLGSRTDNGKSIEDTLEDGQTPDLGF